MAREREEEPRGQQEIVAGMKAWRKAHPKATFVEIEAEMEARINRLREQMLAEVQGMSQAAEEAGAETRCPECGAKMEGRGKRKRQMQGMGGSEVGIEREYLECPACGAGFFPSG